eukprot:6651470-Pyramimonas_sp.AAC.1
MPSARSPPRGRRVVSLRGRASRWWVRSRALGARAGAAASARARWALAFGGARASFFRRSAARELALPE